ncbi:ABC transporter ATP-binding protein YtrB [Peptococcaceae bacterium CEB3]|nr:ABC transporter ATP-binding protein YtrB [Peptococcaceae bacterium CEB3]
MIVVEAKKLGKNYGRVKGGVQAIRGLSFIMEENKIIGLIGRNGAGKTTLLKMIAGYLRPTGGMLRVFEREPFNDLTVSAKTLFVDDSMTFPLSFTLADILREAARFFPGFDAKLAEALAEYFSLNLKKSHHHLSKGTKSTFNAIIGIASHCPLTLFDEPTSGMDSSVRKDFYRALLKDYIQHPRTIILSSHLLSEVEELLEDILLIHAGAECLHLPVADLKEYAIGLRGPARNVGELAQGREILHREEFGQGNIYLVVKKNFSPERLEEARTRGVETVPIATDDLCNYLTGSKGGIDDVFRRN